MIDTINPFTGKDMNPFKDTSTQSSAQTTTTQKTTQNKNIALDPLGQPMSIAFFDTPKTTTVSYSPSTTTGTSSTSSTQSTSKPSTTTTSQPTSQGMSSMFVPIPENPLTPKNPFETKPQDLPVSQKMYTYTVNLGSASHPLQFEAIREQLGTNPKMIVTSTGQILAQFESPLEKEEVEKKLKIPTVEAISRREQEIESKIIAREIWENASGLEKAGMYVHTLLSPRAVNFVGSLLPGGQRPEEVVQEEIVGALPWNIAGEHKVSIPVVSDVVGFVTGKPFEVTLKGEAGWYAEQVLEQPATQIGAWWLAGKGLGALGSVVGNVGSKIPLVGKIGNAISTVSEAITPPIISKAGSFLASHPTLTTSTLFGGLEAWSLRSEYQQLKEQNVPEDIIREKLFGKAVFDTAKAIAFAYGTKSESPKQNVEALGKSSEELNVRIGIEDNPTHLRGEFTAQLVNKDVFLDYNLKKEYANAFKKGKIVEETDWLVKKEYGGDIYRFSKVPTGLPRVETDSDLIPVLRLEKTANLQGRVFDENFIGDVDIFARKGVSIPVQFAKTTETTTDAFPYYLGKGKGGGDVLKDLAEMYRNEEAEKVVKTAGEQWDAIRKATENMLGGGIVEKTSGASVPKSGGATSKGVETFSSTAGKGLEAIVETNKGVASKFSEFGNFPIEYVGGTYVPAVIPIEVEKNVPFITPSITFTGPSTTLKEKQEFLDTLTINRIDTKLKTETKTGELQDFGFGSILSTFESAKGIGKEKFYPFPAPPPIRLEPKRDTSTIPPITITGFRDTRVTKGTIGPPPIILEEPKPSTTGGGGSGGRTRFPKLPLFFPELPKGSIFEFKPKEIKEFSRPTAYEPSLLGVLFGVKKKGKGDFFTGFEIRGI